MIRISSIEQKCFGFESDDAENFSLDQQDEFTRSNASRIRCSFPPFASQRMDAEPDRSGASKVVVELWIEACAATHFWFVARRRSENRPRES